MKHFAVTNVFLCIFFVSNAQQNSFKPGQTTWPDRDGVHINAHGGGVFYYDNTYYWFGEFKNATNNNAEHGISCYSSTDLYNWTNCGIALSVQAGTDIQSGCIMERPKVIYNKKNNKFVMYFHLELKDYGYDAARVGIAVADHVTGPYEFKESLRPNRRQKPVGYISGQDFDNEFVTGVAEGQMSRDMTLFVDDDDKAYYIYASENNATLHISLLSDDYLSQSGKFIRVAPGGYNEAPAIFKREGKYFMITSGCTGWEPNAARLFIADEMLGAWTEYPNPCVGTNAELTFRSQSTYIIPIAGKKNAYIFIADRWMPNKPSSGQYVWLPLQFENGLPVLRWLDNWDLNFFDNRNVYESLRNDIAHAEDFLAAVVVGSNPGEYKQKDWNAFSLAIQQAKSVVSTAANSVVADAVLALSSAASAFQNAKNPKERNTLPDGDYYFKVADRYYLTNGTQIENNQKLRLQSQKINDANEQVFTVTKQMNGRYKVVSKLDGRNVNEDICVLNHWDSNASSWRTFNIYYDGSNYAIQNDGKAASNGIWVHDAENNQLKSSWNYRLDTSNKDFIFYMERIEEGASINVLRNPLDDIVTGQSKNIWVKTTQPMDVYIMAVNGSLVKSEKIAGDTGFPVTSGFYIVKVHSNNRHKDFKILVF